jgi:hypothetical protein
MKLMVLFLTIYCSLAACDRISKKYRAILIIAISPKSSGANILAVTKVLNKPRSFPSNLADTENKTLEKKRLKIKVTSIETAEFTM